MWVKVVQMFECEGRPLPRHRSAMRLPVHVGRLNLVDQYDKDFRRSVVCAFLRNATTGSDVLPPLRDAVVRWIGDGAMSISGLETDSLTRKSVAQSWYAQLIEDAEPAGAGEPPTS